MVLDSHPSHLTVYLISTGHGNAWGVCLPNGSTLNRERRESRRSQSRHRRARSSVAAFCWAACSTHSLLQKVHPLLKHSLALRARIWVGRSLERSRRPTKAIVKPFTVCNRKSVSAKFADLLDHYTVSAIFVTMQNPACVLQK